jgi:C4-dicarboxylate transporter, DctM subunit
LAPWRALLHSNIGYLVLGLFMNVLSMQVLTIPIVLPFVMAVGVDPIWFGVFIVLMCELGMITPPVGMNLYVVQVVRSNGGPFRDVIAGAVPYALIMIAFTLLLIFWPDLVLWLPRSMIG